MLALFNSGTISMSIKDGDKFKTSSTQPPLHLTHNICVFCLTLTAITLALKHFFMSSNELNK